MFVRVTEAKIRFSNSESTCIPTLLEWSESPVCAQCGHLCFKFSPVELGNGKRFNPLAEVRIGTRRDVSDAQNIVKIIVRTGEDNSQGPYWEDAAESVTTGMVFAGMLCGSRDRSRRLSRRSRRPAHSSRANLPGDGPVLLREFIDQKYLPFQRGKWKKSTQGTSENRIEHHIVKGLGDTALNDLALTSLQGFLKGKAGTGLSFSVVDHLRWDRSAIFEMAVAEKVIASNPATRLYTPKFAPKGKTRP